MDVFCKRSHIVVVVLSMMSYIQGNPILHTQANAVDSSDSKINPMASVVDSIGKISNAVKNKKNVNNDDNSNHDSSVIKYNFKDNEDTVIKPETAVRQDQIPSSVPFLGSIPLSESERTKTEAANDISRAFTKKVLLAFFDELKKRPDLVDEIVRRETSRLLMDSGLDGNQVNPLPTESDLTQKLLPISDLQIDINNKDSEKGDDNSKLNSNINDINAKGSFISKKDTQNSAAENPQTLSKDQKGDNSVEESLKLQTALTEGLGGIIMPTQSHESAALNSDDGDSGEVLDPSYYYYVYYDENEDTTAKTNENSDNNSDDVKPSVINEDKIDNKRTNTLGNMDATNYHDTVIEKLTSAVRSVISRDMENQLAKSKMSLSGGSGYGQGSQTADVKGTSQALGNFQDKILTSDDEMQLQKLAG